ncbi:MAG: hypothetical protein ABI678_17140 [Kofleriaceae bacterium]
MRWPFAWVLLTACGGSGDDGPTTRVLALAGEIQVEAGAVVISHAPDGRVIDQQVTDGSGHALLHTEPDALVTLVYQRDTIEVVTTPALATGELVVRGPKPAKAPIIAAALTITAPAIDADELVADLGCATVHLVQFPASIDVAAACLGTDSKLDVLVRATVGMAVVGYAAARVPIVDGVGILDIPGWETAPATIPVTANDLGAVIELDEISDGFVHVTPPGTTQLNAWTGLVADSARVRAQVGFTTAAQTTTSYLPALPASVAFTAEDFLPAATTRVGLPDRAKLAAHWDALAVGDVVDFQAIWMPGTHVIHWDAVLPPDATAIAFPQLDPDLAAVLAPPTGDVVLDTDLRAIDGPDTSDFAGVQAAGLWVDQGSSSTIVPPPATGLVRETNVGGFDD